MIAPKWLNELEVAEGVKGSPLSVLFLCFCTWINTRGSSSAGNFNNIITGAKLVILVFIIIVSFLNFQWKNFEPFLDEEKGFAGVIEASTILFFGYIGFDFMTTVSEESINPQKDVPQAIVFTVMISMTIYAVLSFAVNGVGNLAKSSSGDGEVALAEIF